LILGGVITAALAVVLWYVSRRMPMRPYPLSPEGMRDAEDDGLAARKAA
jgi:hypothetical protein